MPLTKIHSGRVIRRILAVFKLVSCTLHNHTVNLYLVVVSNFIRREYTYVYTDIREISRTLIFSPFS